MKSLSILFLTLIVTLLFSTEPLIPQEEEEALKLCRLNSDEALWSGPSKHFKVVRRAESGLLLEIIGEKQGYYRVRVPDGFPCYIHTDYLEVDENYMGTVMGDRVHLRSIPAIKGDYPIFQVDSGTRLMVWGRVDEWYRVMAPEEAYAYVLMDKVELVEPTNEVEQELAALHGRRAVQWKEHLTAIRADMEAQMKERDMKDRFAALEAAAATGFAGMSLEDVSKSYKEIAALSSDERMRTVSQLRLREVEAISERKKLEKQLLDREAAWKKEQSDLEKALREAKGDKPQPATHDTPGIGRIITAVGVVDTGGPGVVLRGGKSLANILYRIDCPDGRYILGDFSEKRIRVKGRLGVAKSENETRSIVVERIEIM